jgi:hypothetical protein
MFTMTRGKRRRAQLLVLGLTAAALGLIACSEDEGEKSKASTSIYPSKEAFCAGMVAADAPFTEAGQYASREQKVEAAKKVVDLLDGIAKAAPPEIADAAKTKLDAIRTTAGGEPSALIDSETLDATQKIKDYCPA